MRRRSKAILALYLSLELVGCTSWRVETTGPAELILRDRPDRIRVRGERIGQIVLYRPEVQGGNLLGRQRRGARQPDRFIPLADVASVATPHGDAGKTAAMGLGVAAVLGIAVFIAAASIDGPFDSWGQ